MADLGMVPGGARSHYIQTKYVIQICNEWNKRIFCYKNQCPSVLRLNNNKWRHHEYRYESFQKQPTAKGNGGSCLALNNTCAHWLAEI